MTNKKIFHTLFALILINISLIIAQERPENKYSVMSSDELSKQVLASVGPIQITVNEFINNYEFGPAFIKRMKESRKRHLDFMIYEKLLALEGYKSKLDTNDDVKLFLKDIRDDLAGEKVYRNLIWDKIKVSQKEITEAAEKENTEVDLKWIFSKDQNHIVQIYNSLNQGAVFDSIFKEQFKDSVLYEDRYLQTNRFKLQRTNTALASIIDSVAPGSYSRPVKTEDGWYIIKVDNLTKTMLQTESDYNDQRYKIETALRKEKADSASDEIIRQKFLEEQPVIIRTSFNALAGYFALRYLHPDQIQEWKLQENINSKFFRDGSFQISAGSNDTLVKTNTLVIPLQHFIDWFSTREPYIKLQQTSKSVFLNSVQGIVWRMLRDRFIIRMAEKHDSYDDNEIETEMKWWKDKIVYSKLKLTLAASIPITDDKIHQYYLEHKSNYSDTSGIRQFKNVQEQVRQDYYIYEFTKRLVNKVLSLKNKYSVNINEELLNNIPLSEENNPRSIELYSVKKGGTFVHPVYPVIDNEWQFWN